MYKNPEHFNKNMRKGEELLSFLPVKLINIVKYWRYAPGPNMSYYNKKNNSKDQRLWNGDRCPCLNQSINQKDDDKCKTITTFLSNKHRIFSLKGIVPWNFN